MYQIEKGKANMNKGIISILAAAVVTASLAGCAANNNAEDIHSDYVPVSSSAKTDSREPSVYTNYANETNKSKANGYTLKNTATNNKNGTLKLAAGFPSSIPSIPYTSSVTPSTSPTVTYKNTRVPHYSVDCFVEGCGSLTSSLIYPEEGAYVEIFPVADSGYKLVRIESSYKFEGNTFIMPSKDVRITAYFEKIENDPKTEPPVEPTAPDTPDIPDEPTDTTRPEADDNTDFDAAADAAPTAKGENTKPSDEPEAIEDANKALAAGTANNPNPPTGFNVGIAAASLLTAAGCAMIFRKRK